MQLCTKSNLTVQPGTHDIWSTAPFTSVLAGVMAVFLSRTSSQKYVHREGGTCQIVWCYQEVLTSMINPFMYLESNMPQMLMIYCLCADCWYSACVTSHPGIFGSLHMHYSIDLCIPNGKADLQKSKTHVCNAPVSSDGISRKKNRTYLGKFMYIAAIPLSLIVTCMRDFWWLEIWCVYVRKRLHIALQKSWICVHLHVVKPASAILSAARNVFSSASKLHRH